uniref:Uncharacterized protein AlNc14C531G12063 n=1 Tax=Albugo laibachii Nc14 TaxID=890382 RepID=F0X0X2_9STRA|nr:conserved hypothetical protein [Albugo laibachii Nc14]|eukprot:CCA27418.1 conserved hypothetical protein [Albugo laibachii Nc14]
MSTTQKAPKSFLDFLEVLLPIFKYYAILMVFYFMARRFHRALDNESDAALLSKPTPTEKPNLSKELLLDESDDEKIDEEYQEELTTDGSRLVVTSSSNNSLRKRSKQHPLFEGLKKVETELKKAEENEMDSKVSWNDLHMSMLKKYQQKYPDHGLHLADEKEGYDDDFKDLLKKHNIDIEQCRQARKENSA